MMVGYKMVDTLGIDKSLLVARDFRENLRIFIVPGLLKSLVAFESS
jgi:hypothetical protein